jgi:hypothetical protein
LVGTLGPTSTALKVKRKQILGVDVRKACETIIQPEAPMALRLQSSLLLVHPSEYEKYTDLPKDTESLESIINSVATFSMMHRLPRIT